MEQITTKKIIYFFLKPRIAYNIILIIITIFFVSLSCLCKKKSSGKTLLYQLKEHEYIHPGNSEIDIGSGGEAYPILGLERFGKCHIISDGKLHRTQEEKICSNKNQKWKYNFRDIKVAKEKYFLLNQKKYGPFTSYKSTISEELGQWYLIGEKADGKKYIIVNGDTFGPYESVYIDEKTFLKEENFYGAYTPPDFWYFIAQNKNVLIYIINGKSYGPFLNTEKKPLSQYGRAVSSQDGKTFAYFGEKHKNQWYAYKSGKKFGPYRHVKDIRISKDGKNQIFIADKGSVFEYAVYNGTELGPYKNVFTIRILETEDKYLVSAMKHFEEQKYYFTHNKTFGPYEISASSYNSHGKTWGIIFSDDSGQDYLLMNGEKTFGPYWNIKYPIFFSKNTESWATVIAKANKKEFALIDGEEYGPYKSVGLPVGSGDDDWALVASKEKEGNFALIKEKESGPYQMVSEPKFIGNGDLYYFIHENEGKSYANINGTDYDMFSESNHPGFSKSGGDWFILTMKNEKSGLLINGEEFIENGLQAKIVEKENEVILYWISREENKIFINWKEI